MSLTNQIVNYDEFDKDTLIGLLDAKDKLIKEYRTLLKLYDKHPSKNMMMHLDQLVTEVGTIRGLSLPERGNLHDKIVKIIDNVFRY